MAYEVLLEVWVVPCLCWLLTLLNLPFLLTFQSLVAVLMADPDRIGIFSTTCQKVEILENEVS